MRRLVCFMRYIAILAVFCLGLASTTLADEPTHINAGKPSAVSLGVIQATDVGHVRINGGRPLPHRETTYFLHIVRLELYRMTVRARGDVNLLADQSFRYDEQDAKLKLDIKSFTDRIHMTLGFSFYGVWELLQTMLHPHNQGDGFFENNWMIVKMEALERHVPMGYILLVISSAETLLNITSESSTPAPLLMENLPLTNLSAPFPIPDTDLTLLIGSRGANLNFAKVILILNGLLNLAWQDVAVNHRVRPMPEANSGSHLPDGLVVAFRPRMHDGTSLVTATELAEAMTGMVYYILAAQAAFATTVTIVRPNQAGRRVPIGSIEIRGDGQPRVEIGGSANDIVVETS